MYDMSSQIIFSKNAGVYTSEENDTSEFTSLLSNFEMGPGYQGAERTFSAWWETTCIATCCCPELESFYTRKKTPKNQTERGKKSNYSIPPARGRNS